MNTQRVEGSRFRKNDEIERRSLQVRTQRGIEFLKEKREIACNISMSFLSNLKRDSLNSLVDLGNLRSHKQYAMESTFYPQLRFEYQLMGQVVGDIQRGAEVNQQVDGMLHRMCSERANKHQLAIARESIRREEAKKEAERD